MQTLARDINNVSLKLIETAIQGGWIRPLALFHVIKNTFGNSVIFNYKNRMPELARRFNIAPQTLYNYLNELRSKDLILPFENAPHNLHLASTRKIKRELSDKKKAVIIISDTDSLNDVVCRLYAKKIEQHLKYMAFIYAIQRFGKHNQDNMKTTYEGAAGPFFSLSTRNVSNILNLREKTATKVLKKLEELNILKLHPTKPTRLTPEKLDLKILSDYPGYRFVTDNGTYRMFGQRIELLHFPVKIPKITQKRYLSYLKSTQSKNSHNYNMR